MATEFGNDSGRQLPDRRAHCDYRAPNGKFIEAESDSDPFGSVHDQMAGCDYQDKAN